MTLLLAGTLAGTAATAPMTLAMKLIHRSLPPEQQREPIPPRQITMRAADIAGVKQAMDEPTKRAATMASHFGYGAACGAIYGPVSRVLPGGPVSKGILFGLGVWAGSYLGWLPAMGTLPPATRWKAGRNFMMIASHIVWGATLGAAMDRMSRKQGWR